MESTSSTLQFPTSSVSKNTTLSSHSFIKPKSLHLEFALSFPTFSFPKISLPLVPIFSFSKNALDSSPPFPTFVVTFLVTHLGIYSSGKRCCSFKVKYNSRHTLTINQLQTARLSSNLLLLSIREFSIGKL